MTHFIGGPSLASNPEEAFHFLDERLGEDRRGYDQIKADRGNYEPGDSRMDWPSYNFGEVSTHVGRTLGSRTVEDIETPFL